MSQPKQSTRTDATARHQRLNVPVPPGFMALLSKLVGQAMAKEGRRVTAGEVLMALVQTAVNQRDAEPALLAALRAFTEHWDGYEDSEWNEDDKKGVRILREARAAIASAEGQTAVERGGN